MQMFTLCREQGRLKEVEPAVKQFVQQHGAACRLAARTGADL